MYGSGNFSEFWFMKNIIKTRTVGLGTFKDIETMDNNYVVGVFCFFLRSAEELILII